VVDAFYVRDAHGEKIDDPVLLDAVVASIARASGPEPPPPPPGGHAAANTQEITEHC